MRLDMKRCAGGISFIACIMMTSSNRNIFCVTGSLWGESTRSPVPSQRPVTRSFGLFFDLRLNKRFNKQLRRQWFEMPSRSLWRQCNYNFFSAAWQKKNISRSGTNTMAHRFHSIVQSTQQENQSHAFFINKISNVRHNKSPNLNVSRFVVQLSLPNPMKPGVKSRMKM